MTHFAARQFFWMVVATVVTRMGGDGKAEFRRTDRCQRVPIGPRVF
jgi:hypothetical protein